MRRLLLALALAGLVSACSSDDGGAGTEEGSDGAGTTTTAPTSAPTTTAPAAEPTLRSTAFEEGGEIPEEHGGCPPGGNVSPALAWEGLPTDADQLAVTVVDPDAGGFVHWAVAGIDPASAGLAAGEVPSGGVEALNDTGQAGYFGPCPPETHTYVFTVHALAEDPGITATTPGADAVAAIEAASSASASLSGQFSPAG